jgi:hypothetical protein
LTGALAAPRPGDSSALLLSRQAAVVAVGKQERRRTKMSNANDTAPSTNSPTHYAYTVRDREGQKGIWTRIGAAWPQRNGGFKIQLDAIPLDGKVTLCIPEPKDKP